MSDTVVVPKVSIALLALIHPLIRCPFLYPVNAWNLTETVASNMGIERWFAPLLHWFQAQMTPQEASINTLISLDLTDATLQAQQDLKNKLVLNPPPPPLPATLHYILRPYIVEEVPPPEKPSMGLRKGGDMTCTASSGCETSHRQQTSLQFGIQSSPYPSTGPEWQWKWHLGVPHSASTSGPHTSPTQLRS